MFSMKRMAPAMALLVALAAIVALGSNAKAQPFGGNFGNVIFLHPDGSAMQQWTIARDYWYGPDANMYWDMLPEMAVYRGHMTDQLTGTSNGGATVHAFGYKVQGPESFGRDRGRPIRALSGFAGSISREAANRGNPVGLVNDGGIANEPGTGAFFAETDNRGLAQEQTLQLIGGRPGFDGGTPDFINDGEPDPVIIMGGGERWFLPEGTEQCTTAPTLEEPQLDCYVHFVPVDAADDLADGLEDGDTSMDEIAEAIAANGPGRTDGRNLLEEAAEDQYVIIRTRAEFDALMAELESRPTYAPKVLACSPPATSSTTKRKRSSRASTSSAPTPTPFRPRSSRIPSSSPRSAASYSGARPTAPSAPWTSTASSSRTSSA
jgi:alkaline phosphatase